MTATSQRKKLTPEEFKKIRERDHRKVRGVFRCFEPRGGSFSFTFKKYRGDEVLKYTMTDGETYEVPMMVAHHLNKNCCYPVHSHVLDANGQPIVDQSRKVHRCSFESLEFFTEDE